MLFRKSETVAALNRTGPVLFDRLEDRRMFDAGDGAVVSAPREAPPAMLEFYSRDETNTQQQTSGTKMAVFDVTFSAGESWGERAYWTSLSVWPKVDGKLVVTKESLEALAHLLNDGGTSKFEKYTVTPDMFTTIDFEGSESVPYDVMEDNLHLVREIAPNARITTYGLWLGNGLNRDAIINPSPQALAKFDADCLARAGVVNQLDSINITAYLLGPACVDRDLEFIEAYTAHIRRNFPGKPITAYVWGLYHPSWNGWPSYIPNDVLTRYVQTLRENVDGVFVWGNKSDNTYLFEALQQPGALDLPAERASTTNWIRARAAAVAASSPFSESGISATLPDDDAISDVLV